MKQKSLPIAARIRRILLSTQVVTLSILMLMFNLAIENIEQTGLELDQTDEIEHFLKGNDLSVPQRLQTATLSVVYLPHANANANDLPIVFRDLPIPYSGELDLLDKSYSIIIDDTGGGTYYMAKDLTAFEHRESLLMLFGLIAVIVTIVIATLISNISTRRIVSPLQRLSDEIESLDPEHPKRHLPSDYNDNELIAIVTATNQLLERIELLIEHERSLVTMASHELRTPIAIISGATEVLEHRGTLSPDDKKTVDRIASAARDMKGNVDALLRLVRRRGNTAVLENVDIGQCIMVAAEALGEHFAEGRQRLIGVDKLETVVVRSDETLVKMLIQNLLNNALNHTSGNVHLCLKPQGLRIQDEGSGLPATSLKILKTGNLDGQRSAGLGLFIVTLIASHLGWHLRVDSSERGTNIELGFTNSDPSETRSPP